MLSFATAVVDLNPQVRKIFVALKAISFFVYALVFLSQVDLEFEQIQG